MITAFILTIFDNIIGFLLFALFGIFDLLPQTYEDNIINAINSLMGYISPILKYVPAWETEWTIIRAYLGIAFVISGFYAGTWIYNKLRGSG